jgi:hypothetical protein
MAFTVREKSAAATPYLLARSNHRLVQETASSIEVLN